MVTSEAFESIIYFLRNTVLTNLWDDFKGCQFQVGPRAREGCTVGSG